MLPISHTWLVGSIILNIRVNQKGLDNMSNEMMLLLEYVRISKSLNEKQNELIRCKSKQQEEQLMSDIHILDLLYQDVSYQLDRLYE